MIGETEKGTTKGCLIDSVNKVRWQNMIGDRVLRWWGYLIFTIQYSKIYLAKSKMSTVFLACDE